MEDVKIKHLEIIQGVTTRMNQNSFILKGWMITIVSALFALYADKGDILLLFITIFPIFIFWSLDAYYLQQERKFRGIYNDLVEGRDIPPFKIPLEEYNSEKDCKYCYCNVFWSKTIAGLYCTILVLLLLCISFVLIKDCVFTQCNY